MTAADTSTIPRNVEGPSTQLCLLWKPAMFPYATLHSAMKAISVKESLYSTPSFPSGIGTARASSERWARTRCLAKRTCDAAGQQLGAGPNTVCERCARSRVRDLGGREHAQGRAL